MRKVVTASQNIDPAVRDLVQASQENDVVDIAANFSLNGTYTQTTTLNLTSPTAANVAAVLATLLTIMQKGGINRTT